MATATKVGPALDTEEQSWKNGGENAAHYVFNPPYKGVEHFVVSSIDDFLGKSTAAFPATADGAFDPVAYREVFNHHAPEVFELGHKSVLDALGYEIEEN